MSSMRSASSSTSQRVSERLTSPSRTRSVSRPGVAMRMSTPGAIFLTWLKRDTPPSTSAVETCSALGQHADRVLDLHGEFARRRQDQRARRLRRALGAERDDLGQDRQAEGRRLAGAGLGDREHVAAGEMRRDGLDLDRLRFDRSRRRTVAFSSGPVIPSLAKPFSSALFSFVNLFFFHAAFGRKQPLPQGATCVGQNILMNDKAADTLVSARLRCRARRHHARGTFSPLAEKPEREKTDATSPIDRESRIIRPKRLCRRIWASSPEIASPMLQCSNAHHADAPSPRSSRASRVRGGADCRLHASAAMLPTIIVWRTRP